MTDAPGDMAAKLEFFAGAAEERFGYKYDDAKIFRAAASLIRDMSEREKQSAALIKLIHDNLGEYVEREGTVDVTIALAFEASRSMEAK